MTITGTSPYDSDRSGWTDERDAELKRLRASGLSMSQIAVELGGVTRNAVIGRLHRLGIKGPARPKAHTEPGVRVKRHGKSGVRAVKIVVRTPPPPEPAVPTIVEPAGPGVDLMGLTSSTCRWPLHDDCEPARFCGARPEKGKPYCGACCRIAFLPVSRRPEGVDYRVKRMPTLTRFGFNSQTASAARFGSPATAGE